MSATSYAGAADTVYIEVRHLWKVFGHGRPDRALALAAEGADRGTILAETGQTIGVRDVSFEVRTGETFVVMGLSGSGKSTLIRCMSRLIEPTSGEVTVDGENLLAMDDEALRRVRRTKMSMVFQHFGLFPHRRVIDNVAYGLEVQGVGKVERRRRAAEVIELVGLTSWAHQFPQQLSGGMQQRVGLARALALDPELLYFDEPFSALDPLIRREMQSELLRLQQEMHRTIVFITHDFDEALRLGDRIAIMKDGVLDQIGTPEEIVLRPATRYVREFTEAVPKSKVLSVRSVMSDGVAPSDARVVGCDDTVDSIVPILLGGAEMVGVTDPEGRSIGVVSRQAVARMLAGDRA